MQWVCNQNKMSFLDPDPKSGYYGHITRTLQGIFLKFLLWFCVNNRVILCFHKFAVFRKKIFFFDISIFCIFKMNVQKPDVGISRTVGYKVFKISARRHIFNASLHTNFQRPVKDRTMKNQCNKCQKTKAPPFDENQKKWTFKPFGETGRNFQGNSTI